MRAQDWAHRRSSLLGGAPSLGGKQTYCRCHVHGASYLISGFRHEVAEHCALRGYYAASRGNFLPMFVDNLSDS